MELVVSSYEPFAAWESSRDAAVPTGIRVCSWLLLRLCCGYIPCHWHLISLQKLHQHGRCVYVLPHKPRTKLGCKQFTAGVNVTL